MDEISDGIFRLIGGIIRWFLLEIIYQIVIFNIGRFSLLLITLGRYPQRHCLEKDANRIAWIGILVLILAWIAIALYNNYM